MSTNHGAGAVRVMMRALYDYQAVEDDELSLTAGTTFISLPFTVATVAVCCWLQ